MFLVIAKLIEVLARAGFTVGATFMLPLEQAGQFGIIATLANLFAFAIGWERYIDLQRRLVDSPPAVFDAAVRHAFRLWAANAVWLLPPFVLLTGWWTGIDTWSLLLCVIIVVGEHIANQVYNLAVVERRYHGLVAWVAARNLLLLGVIAAALFDPALARLDYILTAWAIIAGGSTLIIGALWAARLHRGGELPPEVATGVVAQGRASLTHFGMGLLGVLMLQLDRLTVGGLLPLDQVGVYFRHVLLVSFAYQFFNIASYNRKVPLVFARARTHDVADAQAIVRRELIKVFAVVLAGFGVVWLADQLTAGIYAARFSVRLDLAALLLAGALVRIAADFNALILNSRMRERWVLRQQLIAFGTGAILLIGLTFMFDMWGTAIAAGLTSVTYLLLNLRAVARLDRAAPGPARLAQP